VLLSGWGGDEVVAFNGRGYFADLFRRGRWTLMARELYLRARLHQGNFWQGLRNDTILPLLPDGLIRMLNPASPLVQHDLPLPSTLQAEFADRLKRVKTIQAPNLRERPGVRNNQIRLLRSGHLLKRIESWAAKALERCRISLPLLDRRIIEFGLSIQKPCSLKTASTFPPDWQLSPARRSTMAKDEDRCRFRRILTQVRRSIPRNTIGRRQRSCRG
jgi:asparagine synthase (glutamine-hydrolysing)